MEQAAIPSMKTAPEEKSNVVSSFTSLMEKVDVTD